MKPILRMMIALSSLAFLACAPDERAGGELPGGDDPGGDDPGNNRPDGGFVDATPAPACTPTGTEVCTGSVDDDCDGVADCADPDCSGVGDCPVCGAVEHPLSTPLALPDGVGTSYTSALNFRGFGMNQRFEDVSDILSVCVKMEHSWLRDLQIELLAPSGQTLILQEFLGQTGSEVFMGTPNDDDTATSPVPGVGADYCWKPDATQAPMLIYANTTAVQTLPPGDYQSAKPFTDLVGATMNGDWTIKVTDLWAIDNGYIFEWSIAFNPDIFEDCSTPPVQ